MRVLLDANILISALLAQHPDRVAFTLVQAAVRGEFVLLLPEGLLEEVVAAVRRKPFLKARIRPEELEELAAILTTVGEVIPRIDEPIPRVTRDPKDDYLVAYAVVGEADYLVTGDRDFLVLGQLDDLRILSPRAFLTLLEEIRRARGGGL